MKLIFLLIFVFSMSLVMGFEDTIVCVHGFMRKGGNMSAITRSFQKEGCMVVNWTYPSRQKTIEEHAEDLVKDLQFIAQGKPISFVTHSMGGLIVRCALNHPDCPEDAKRGKAVLIAPPNGGSSLARYLHQYAFIRRVLGDKSGKQLMTAEDFDHLGDFPEQMPVLVIAGTMGFNPFISGKNDGKVTVAETRLSTLYTHETVCAGHCWISHCPTTLQKAKHFMLGIPHRPKCRCPSCRKQSQRRGR